MVIRPLGNAVAKPPSAGEADTTRKVVWRVTGSAPDKADSAPEAVAGVRQGLQDQAGLTMIAVGSHSPT